MNATKSCRFILAVALVACGSEPAADGDTATTTTTQPASPSTTTTSQPASPSTTSGPSGTAPDTGSPCELVELPLAVDEVSPLGLAAIDVDAALAGEESNEFAHADGTPTTVRVQVVPSGAPVFWDWSPLVAGAACDDDALRVPYEVTVTTDDGIIGFTVPYTFHGGAVPDDLFLNEYPLPGALTGSLPAPAGAQSLSVVVFHDGAGVTNGVLQWVVGGGGGGGTATGGGPLSEENVGAWGSYR